MSEIIISEKKEKYNPYKYNYVGNKNLELEIVEKLRWEHHALDDLVISQIAESAQYVSETAKKFSMENKKPVFLFCNARSGTLLHYGIEKWYGQLTKNERSEFVKDMKSQPSYSESRILALFDTAQQWMDNGRINWFVYSTQNVKVSSLSRKNTHQPVEKLPKHFSKMLKKGINFAVADVSTQEFPGSFGKGCGQEKELPGYKEIFEEEKYKIMMLSRQMGSSKKEFFKKGYQKNSQALLINPIRTTDSYYNLIDNHNELIGWFGIKFAHGDYDLLILLKEKPLIVQTTQGKMEASEYLRLKIMEYCSRLRKMEFGEAEKK